MQDYISEILQNQSKELVEKKEAVIISRLKQLGLIEDDFDFKRHMASRFPKGVCEIWQDQSEHYWWNDGTEKGKHVVSFYLRKSGIEEVENKIIGSISYSISYEEPKLFKDGFR